MLSAKQVKEQILMQHDAQLGLKRTSEKAALPNLTSADVITLGKNLESLTKHPGWAYFEQKLISTINIEQILTQTDLQARERLIVGATVAADLLKWVDYYVRESKRLQAQLETNSQPAK